MYPSHVAFSAAGSALVGAIAGAGELTFPMAMIGGAAGLLPDLDHPKSKLGRMLPFLSYPLYWIFGHREATHSLLFATTISFPIFFTSLYMGIAVFLGITLHLVGDAITASHNNRVPFFFPHPKRYGIRLFKVGGIVENFVVLPLLLVISFLL